MSNERLRTKQELKNLFTNLKRKGITDDMISILIDALWREKPIPRTAGFYAAGGWDAEIAFDISTRVFSVTPFDTLVEDFKPRYMVFTWANEAHAHRIFDTHEIEIPEEEGLFFVYFDKEPDPGRNPMLFVKKNPTEQEILEIYLTKIMIASLYWDATNDELIYFGNDKHGSEWNPQLHRYLHLTNGARRKSGLTITGASFGGDGSDNAHAKFSVIGGVMLHDDFELEIPSSSDSIPILYQQGFFPRYVYNSGYAIYKGAARACFNSGGAIIQAASGNFLLYHIFATNEIGDASRKIISVMGSAEYTTLADAYTAAPAELDALNTWMPQQGRFHIDTIVVQTSDDFTNDAASIIVNIATKTHPPVTIADNSKDLLDITGKQELSIPGDFEADEFYALKNRIWQKITEDGSFYKWNIHSPEQIIGYLSEPANIIVNVNGAGTIDETIPAGEIVVTAINEAGETLASNVPAFDILVDTTEAIISWDAVEGATAYRIYNTTLGEYLEITATSIDYFIFTPDTAALPPIENTAAIYQSPFIIANDDTVMVIGEGIDVETVVDELEPTKKILLLKKQRTDWDATGPNGIDNKPTIPEPTVNTDEKVKFDAADPTAGYLSEKIIAGTNITITEGTGVDENKLKITATGSGGTREYIVYNEAELIAAWTDARLDTTRSAIIYIGAHIDLTANRSFLISDPSHQWIEFRAVSSQNININSFTFSINRVTCRDLGFRTNVQTYVTVDGHYANFFNCSWNDEAFYSASISSMKIAIKLKGTINSNTGKIQLENPKHISSTSYAINTGNIQPFIIQNTTSSWSGTNQQMYIEIQRFDSVLSFTRFSKVLLVSTAGNVPYKVTGDLTWYYHPDQQWAGTGNIHSSSELLKQGSIDDIRADFIPSDTITQILGITSAGLIRKMSGVSATFTTVDGKTVTVVNGIITSVV